MSYFVLPNLTVSASSCLLSGFITSVGEERADITVISFWKGSIPLPLCA